MTTQEARTTLNSLCKQALSICEIADTAKRGRKSLSGSNAYSNKFHEAVLGFRKTEGDFLRVAGLEHVDEQLLGDFKMTVACISGDMTDGKVRTERTRHLRTICETRLIPLLEGMTASPVPVTEQVLPLEVVKGTRGYFIKWITQANGCYEHQWFDACSVMLRKFVENLIINIYEAHGFAEDIKKDGNFHMLGELINRYLAQTHWTVGRETKTCLPEIKLLGDRAAHNRTFTVNKVDVDKALVGFRVTAAEMLNMLKRT